MYDLEVAMIAIFEDFTYSELPISFMLGSYYKTLLLSTLSIHNLI